MFQETHSLRLYKMDNSGAQNDSETPPLTRHKREEAHKITNYFIYATIFYLASTRLAPKLISWAARRFFSTELEPTLR